MTVYVFAFNTKDYNRAFQRAKQDIEALKSRSKDFSEVVLVIDREVYHFEQQGEGWSRQRDYLNIADETPDADFIEVVQNLVDQQEYMGYPHLYYYLSNQNEASIEAVTPLLRQNQQVKLRCFMEEGYRFSSAHGQQVGAALLQDLTMLASASMALAMMGIILPPMAFLSPMAMVTAIICMMMPFSLFLGGPEILFGGWGYTLMGLVKWYENNLSAIGTFAADNAEALLAAFVVLILTDGLMRGNASALESTQGGGFTIDRIVRDTSQPGPLSFFAPEPLRDSRAFVEAFQSLIGAQTFEARILLEH